jgi:hypothetical protein
MCLLMLALCVEESTHFPALPLDRSGIKLEDTTTHISRDCVIERFCFPTGTTRENPQFDLGYNIQMM